MHTLFKGVWDLIVRSGHPVLLPVVLKPPVDATATQGDDGVGAADRPEHTGSLEARSDDALAASFDHSG